MPGPGGPLAAFVDGGYLRELGAAAWGVTASEIAIDGPSLVLKVRQLADRHQVLRTYVYEGQFDPTHDRREFQDAEHRGLADTPGIRLRLGKVKEKRRGGLVQKGVDTLFVLDVLQMAQVGAYSTALLFAGDSDFVEVVDAVQRLGRRVEIIAPAEIPGLSVELRQAADRVHEVQNLSFGLMARPPGAPDETVRRRFKHGE